MKPWNPMILIANMIINLILLALVGSIYFGLVKVIQAKKPTLLSGRTTDLLMKAITVYWATPLSWAPILLFSNINYQEIPTPGEDGHIGWTYIFTPIDMIIGKNYITAITITLFTIWLIGAIWNLADKIYRYQNIIKWIQASSTKNNDPECEQILKELIQENHLKQTPELYWCTLNISAFLIGWRKPKIYLPEMNLSKVEKEYILRHELTHFKKRDLLFRFLLIILQILYWFNPFISIFVQEFKEINEVACDETVLQTKGMDIRKMYAKLLVRMLKKQTEIFNVVFFADYNETSMKWRLTCIMNQTRNNYRILSTLIAVLCIISYPVTVFASSAGMTAGESVIVEKVLEANAIRVEAEIPSHTEQTRHEIPENINTELMLTNIHDVNIVDQTLNEGVTYYLAYVYLDTGSYVQFTLAQVDGNGSYRAGIIDSHYNLRTVDAINGIVTHKFMIETSDYYHVLIQGLSADNTHVVGPYYIP